MSSLTAEETAAMFADLGVSGTGYMVRRRITFGSLAGV